MDCPVEVASYTRMNGCIIKMTRQDENAYSVTTHYTDGSVCTYADRDSFTVAAGIYETLAFG